jgi:hypothetical protein
MNTLVLSPCLLHDKLDGSKREARVLTALKEKITGELGYLPKKSAGSPIEVLLCMLGAKVTFSRSPGTGKYVAHLNGWDQVRTNFQSGAAGAAMDDSPPGISLDHRLCCPFLVLSPVCNPSL